MLRHEWLGGRPQGTDPETLQRHFGVSDALPLWIAEPAVDLLPELTEALVARARDGWYGYETRPEAVLDAFRSWVSTRHGWSADGADLLVSPSIGTTIAVAIDLMTEPGDGVIIQPPVFTDFKPLVVRSGRAVVRNPLLSTDDGYRIDFDGLAEVVAEPSTRMMILCNPHNPVGRVWTADELARVAEVCAEHDVFVLADEVHADLALAPHRFVPFGSIADDSGVRWAATHGPIKTFGLAGVSDTVFVAGDGDLSERFAARSAQFHLNRNNVFGMMAFEVAYRHGADWLDRFLDLVSSNLRTLRERLPAEIGISQLEGTYLAWLDMRALGLDVAEIGTWFAQRAGVAISPGHWFGREGAGFARMTIAARPDVIERAADGVAAAVAAG